MARTKNTCHISIALSLAERAEIDQRVAALGVSRNSWLREVIAKALSDDVE